MTPTTPDYYVYHPDETEYFSYSIDGTPLTTIIDVYDCQGQLLAAVCGSNQILHVNQLRGTWGDKVYNANGAQK